MKSQLYIQTLPPKTAGLTQAFQKQNPAFLKNFYLSGGTALSLQLGHRESEDLDFFSKNSFKPQDIETELKQFGSLHQTEISIGTLNTFLHGVQLQFLEYPYKLLKPLHDWKGIKLSSTIDIACTKLQTIGSRGSKKDFIDIYFLLEIYSLSDLFKAMEKKYPRINYSQTHILKSLLYFKDAESQPMPRMHKRAEWKAVKSQISEIIKKFSF